MAEYNLICGARGSAGRTDRSLDLDSLDAGGGDDVEVVGVRESDWGFRLALGGFAFGSRFRSKFKYLSSLRMPLIRLLLLKYS